MEFGLLIILSLFFIVKAEEFDEIYAGKEFIQRVIPPVYTFELSRSNLQLFSIVHVQVPPEYAQNVTFAYSQGQKPYYAEDINKIIGEKIDLEGQSLHKGIFSITLSKNYIYPEWRQFFSVKIDHEMDIKIFANSSQFPVCFINCSGDFQGTCMEQQKCDCNQGFFGKGCQFKGLNAQLDKTVKLNLLKSDYYPIVLPKSQDNLKATITVKSGQIDVFQKYIDDDQDQLPYYNNYQNAKFDLVSKVSFIYNSQLRQNINYFIGLSNKNNEISEVNIKVSKEIEQQETKEYDWSFYVIYSVIGFIVSCIGLTLYIILKQYRIRMGIMSSYEEVSQIQEQILQKFPPKEYLNNQNEEEDDIDIDCCAICIDNFKFKQLVRLLGCFHMFHQGCIDEWVKQSTVIFNQLCPVCKGNLLQQNEPDFTNADSFQKIRSITSVRRPSQANRNNAQVVALISSDS